MAQLLLDVGADGAAPSHLNHRSCDRMRQPLEAAVLQGSPAMVSLLLQAGADPNVKPSCAAATLLGVAAGRGRTAVVQVLVEAGARSRGPTGHEALLRAIVSESCSDPVAVVKVLLSNEHDPPTAADVVRALLFCHWQPQQHQVAARLLRYAAHRLEASFAARLLAALALGPGDPAAARLALLHSWCADTAADDAGVEGLSAQQQDLAAQAAGVRELLVAVALDEKQSSSSSLAVG